MSDIGRKIKRRLHTLDNIHDRGLLIGSSERREAQRVMQDLRELAHQVADMEAAARVKARDERLAAESPAPGVE